MSSNRRVSMPVNAVRRSPRRRTKTPSVNELSRKCSKWNKNASLMHLLKFVSIESRAPTLVDAKDAYGVNFFCFGVYGRGHEFVFTKRLGSWSDFMLTSENRALNAITTVLLRCTFRKTDQIGVVRCMNRLKLIELLHIDLNSQEWCFSVVRFNRFILRRHAKISLE